MPKSMKMTLPEDGGSFNFLISATADGKIAVSSKIVLKKKHLLCRRIRWDQTVFQPNYRQTRRTDCVEEGIINCQLLTINYLFLTGWEIIH